MNHNVKPGDRAVVINHICKENIGKIVDVVRAYAPGEILPGMQHPFVDLMKLGQRWVIEPMSGRLTVLQGMGPGKPPVRLSVAAMAIYDKWLRRLPDPDELDDDTSERRERSLTKELAEHE